MVALGEAYLEPAEELLRQYEQTGDERAFEQIVLRHRGLVYSVCHRIMRNNHDAEDATQAVFLTLAMQVRGGTQIHALPAWLSQVAHRVSLDMYKSRKRRQAREDIRRQQTIDRFEPEESRELDQTDLRETLRKQLNELPAKYRTPMVLYYFGGLAPEQIAKELGMKKKTLGVRLFRARKLLAEQLAARGLTTASCAAVMFALSDIVRQGLWNTTYTAPGYAATSLATAAAGQGLGVDHLSGTILAMSRALGRFAFGSRLRFSMLLLVALGTAMAGYASLVRALPGVDLPGVKQMAPSFNGVVQDLFESIPQMLGGRQFSDASAGKSASQQATPPPVVVAGGAEPRHARPITISPVPVTQLAGTQAPPRALAPQTPQTSGASPQTVIARRELPLPVARERTLRGSTPAISLASRGSLEDSTPSTTNIIAAPTAPPVIIAAAQDSGGRTAVTAAKNPVDSTVLLPDDGEVIFAGVDSAGATGLFDPTDDTGGVSIALNPNIDDDGFSFGIAGGDGLLGGDSEISILNGATAVRPANTPEPTGALLLIGLTGLLARRSRR